MFKLVAATFSYSVSQPIVRPLTTGQKPVAAQKLATYCAVRTLVKSNPISSEMEPAIASIGYQIWLQWLYLIPHKIGCSCPLWKKSDQSGPWKENPMNLNFATVDTSSIKHQPDFTWPVYFDGGRFGWLKFARGWLAWGWLPPWQSASSILALRRIADEFDLAEVDLSSKSILHLEPDLI